MSRVESDAMIARAREAQEERKGVETKVRFPKELVKRMKAAAGVLDLTVVELVNGACRGVMSGRFGVPCGAETEKGTRKDSETVTVRVPKDWDVKKCSVRLAVQTALDHYEPLVQQRLEEIQKRPVEGKDYFVEGKNYNWRKV